MIRGIHGLLYSSEPDAARDFFKDKVKLPFSDVGQGWLIFDLAEGDLGIHPTEGGPGGGHDVSFYCDDIHGTVADMKARGVTFEGDVQDHGYGLVTYFAVPGGLRVQLYEPRYVKKSAKPAAKAKAAVKKVAAKAKSAAKKVAKKAKARKPAKKRR